MVLYVRCESGRLAKTFGESAELPFVMLRKAQLTAKQAGRREKPLLNEHTRQTFLIVVMMCHSLFRVAPQVKYSHLTDDQKEKHRPQLPK